MDPCECINALNARALIEQIIDMANSQRECTDTHCFTSDDSANLSDHIDPVASFSTIGVAMMAFFVIMLLLPNNIRGRGGGGGGGERRRAQTQSTTNGGDGVGGVTTTKHARDYPDDDRDDGPGGFAT